MPGQAGQVYADSADRRQQGLGCRNHRAGATPLQPTPIVGESVAPADRGGTGRIIRKYRGSIEGDESGIRNQPKGGVRYAWNTPGLDEKGVALAAYFTKHR